MVTVTLAIASSGYSRVRLPSRLEPDMNAATRKFGDQPTRPVRRGVSDLVVAQVAGAIGGLMLALDQVVPSAPRRHRIVDKELTRC